MRLLRALTSPRLVLAFYASAIALCAVSARGSGVILLLFSALSALVFLLQHKALPNVRKPGYVDIAVLLFSLYALASALWAENPSLAVMRVLGVLAAYAAFKVAMIAGADSEPDLRRAALGGIAIGVVAIGSLLAIDLLLNRGLSVWLLNVFPALQETFGAAHLRMAGDRVIGISDAGLGRSTAMIGMLLIPTVMIALQIDKPWLRRFLLGMLLVIAAVILLLGTHQSTQLSIVVAALTGLAYTIHRNLGRVLLIAGWSVAVFLVVPLSIWAYETDRLNDLSALFNSARTRVVIWGQVARATLKSPIIGVGVEGSRLFAMDARIVAGESEPKRFDGDGGIYHPHNAYLQVWYELGAIGAILFFLIGIAAIREIFSRNGWHERWNAMLFTFLSVIIAPSYGIWQLWLGCAIALAVWVQALAISSREPADQRQPLAGASA